MADPNRALFESVVRLLAPVLDDLVFVGGCTTGLFITDPAAAGVRPTVDVDAIVDVASYAGYAALAERLRALGLGEDTSPGAPMCRWRRDGVVVDVMPVDERILGFSNRWYPAALATARALDLAEHRVRVVTPALFVATKLEAFRGRGRGDFLASRRRPRLHRRGVGSVARQSRLPRRAEWLPAPGRRESAAPPGARSAPARDRCSLRTTTAVPWLRLLCAMVTTIGLAACTPACQPAPNVEASVTCAGVRALRLGMSQDEVVTLIGEGRPQGVTSVGTELWTYAEGQFSLEFDYRGTLFRAQAGLSRLRLTEHPTRVFSLGTPGVAGEEGDEFERFFRCP